jgi:hypothetical protein
MREKLFIVLVLLLANATLASAKDSGSTGAQNFQCDQDELLFDGGILNLNFKDVRAKVKSADLITVLNSIGENELEGDYLRNGSNIRCTATASIYKISTANAEGVHELTLRINTSCSSNGDYEATEGLKIRVVKSLINSFSGITGLEIDPSWNKCPHSGGGVTGSN